MSRLSLIFALAFYVMCGAVNASDLAALARVVPGQAELRDVGDSVELHLGITQAVPYRIFTLTDPMRVVVDFNELDWAGVDARAFDQSDVVTSVGMGGFRPGWSRLVLELNRPLQLEAAAMTARDDLSAEILLRLVPTEQSDFEASAGAPEGALFAPETGVALAQPMRRQTGDRPLVVVLDPGHGGIDPGAEVEGTKEADLMLTFARELKEGLLRVGFFDVVLTRDADVFVPLETRLSIARAAKADVFISLHADVVIEGRASGATIYTLSPDAADLASQKLSERHERDDILAGVDLSDQDDVIADVLMDMARVETMHRTDQLADALVQGLIDTVGMHKRPKLQAGFSVLKAADIPSVLLELGFLSSPRDRERLLDPEWRAKAVTGIRIALQAWAVEDAADALLLRQ
ncbi:MAG: N-acetylmuramoyl-L-alanine amidase [Marinosulfonomonas sp.]